MSKTLAILDLRTHVIEWVREDDGNVTYIEKWSGEEDHIVVELGNVSDDEVIEDLVKRLNDELKIPKPILGQIKAKIKQCKLPIVMKLVEQGMSNVIECKGSKGNFQVVIKYQIV